MGNTPAIGLRVTLEGVETTEARLKAARAEVRQIKKDLQDAVKTGQDVEKQFKRLNEAYANVDRIKASGKGMSQSGLARGVGGGGMQFNTTSRSSGGNRGFFDGGNIRGRMGDAKDALQAAQGIATGDYSQAARAIASPSGLAGGLYAKAGAAGGLALVGVTAAFNALEGTKKLNQDESSRLDARTKLRDTLLERGNKYGMRGTDKEAKRLEGMQFQQDTKDLGFWEKLGLNIQGNSDALDAQLAAWGVKTIDARMKEASQTVQKQYAEATKHTEEAMKAAGLGDLARAQKEQNAALNSATGAARTIVAQDIAAQGTPAEQYLRAENVRRFNAEYTQLHDKRGSLRTGD